MDYYDVKRLALVLAVQAEIEGMKAENMSRQSIGSSPAYVEGHFCDMAEQLRTLAQAHNEQL